MSALQAARGPVRFVVLSVVLSVLAACGSSSTDPVGDEIDGNDRGGGQVTDEPTDAEAGTAGEGVEETATEALSPGATEERDESASSVPHVSDYGGTLPAGRIVFTSDRADDSDLWLVRPDGGGLEQLTSADHADWRGDWAPDGTAIVFASQRAAFGDDGYIGDTAGGLQPYGLYLVEVDDGRTTHLLGGWEDRQPGGPRGSGRAFNNSPEWSPDGSRIAFTSDAGGDHSVYVMEAATGAEVQQLTDPSLEAYYPTWSPDGTRLAFSARTDPDSDLDLMVVDADGSDAEPLVDDGANQRMPAWSPDGSSIVFVSDRGGSGDLYLVDVTSGEVTELLVSDDDLSNPSWSPDGGWLVFESKTDRDTEVELIRADGTDRLRLTDDPARDGFPDWGP